MPRKIKQEKSFRQKVREEKEADPLYQRGKLKTFEEIFRDVVDNMTRKACEQAAIEGRDYDEENIRQYMHEIGLKADRKGLLIK